MSSFPNSNIGGSVYLTINSGSYGSVAGAYWDMDGSNNLKIGGSVNTTINGGRIANLFGGSLDGGRSSAQNNIQMGDVNLVINASSSSDKISIGSVSGLNNSVRESAKKLSIVFTGNGDNLDFTGTVSSIKSDSYASNLTWYALVKERVISFGSGEDSFVG